MRHCALNVALYGKGGRWAMTERAAAAVRRTRTELSIGPSTLSWDGSGLTVHFNEITVPIPRRVRGTLRLYPSALETRVSRLDDTGRHRWQPIAPCARVEVALDRPSLSWAGSAYFDTNQGDRPLEQDFVRWDWSRTQLPAETAILYDIERRNGPLTLALRYKETGGVADFEPPPAVNLPRTLWRVPRRIQAATPALVHTLEDTPFYTRSVVAAQVLGQPAIAMHESLSMDRFAAPWVQAMLPFRMPRR